MALAALAQRVNSKPSKTQLGRRSKNGSKFGELSLQTSQYPSQPQACASLWAVGVELFRAQAKSGKEGSSSEESAGAVKSNKLDKLSLRTFWEHSAVCVLKP
eukprot:CAMPEP_0202849720 /NCGR_PEP_ID=MMETSP1389-20130828/81566_1 /ASSEMBLY_ACC=CAM_ASM_000865 /TAXON_ID=302021 /ORGANISM="Rhodomonas sp., Strain CCMP768" /LENGTH=101 /DNA_ID=CAMNT_0049527791 /DNA_START=70 /DNA_END=372 /DNA_ORIENTATION=-